MFEKWKSLCREFTPDKLLSLIVQEGEFNPAIKDGKGNVGITPPKSNWALRFEKPPFYAYPVTCGITFTFGGIRADENGRVLDKNDSPIPGLFAAGEMIGGLFYHNYPGGSGLMSGAVFGKLSGHAAANYVFQTTEQTSGETYRCQVKIYSVKS